MLHCLKHAADFQILNFSPAKKTYYDGKGNTEPCDGERSRGKKTDGKKKKKLPVFPYEPHRAHGL